MDQWYCYTDGSVRLVRGTSKHSRTFIGAWAYTMLCPSTKQVIEAAEACHPTTISRMELLAVINALRKFDRRGSIVIYSDSQYVVNSANIWIKHWRKAGWQKEGGEVKHRDLMEEMDWLIHLNKAEVKWIRGHDGNAGNERADMLATRSSKAMKNQLESSYYSERVL
jgi:ribonuclease HI